MTINLNDIEQLAGVVSTKQAELDAATDELSRLCVQWARDQHGIPDDQYWVLESSDKRRFRVDSAKYVPGVHIAVSGYVLNKEGQACSLRRSHAIAIN